MKNKLTIISQFGIVAVALCFAARAVAQKPKSYPTPSPASPATKWQTAAAALSVKDKAFMRKAAKGGMMEVAMGKVAEEKGRSDDVKAFGKRMVTDHSKANDELTALAEKKGLKLSKEKPSEKWTSDKDYMDMMLKDHEKDLAEFQDEAKDGNDPDVKKFAADTAKVVKKHLELAKKTQGKLQ